MSDARIEWIGLICGTLIAALAAGFGLNILLALILGLVLISAIQRCLKKL